MSCVFCKSDKESVLITIEECSIKYCPECFNYELLTCKHENSNPVLFEYESGVKHKRLLCLDCNTIHGKFLTQVPNEVLRPVSQKKYDAYKLPQNKKFNDLLEPIRIKADKWRAENWFKNHGDYLNSQKWKEKRTKVLERDGYLCQSCRINKATEVHHLTYAHKGNEPLFDLISVCHECHESITMMDRMKSNMLKPQLTE
jgi:hypothetical protein